MVVQRRCVQQSLADVRFSVASDGPIIVGNAAVFFSEANPGSEYQLADDLWERIRPGAFDRAVRERHDCRCVYNHDPNCLLGRTSSGTCRLRVDAKGLVYEVDLNLADPDHARVAEKIKRGDLTGSSFAFRPSKVFWEELPGGGAVRWIEDLMLYDVGPVTYPAYEATTTGLRHDDDQVAAIRAEYEAWKSVDLDWRKRQLMLWELEAAAQASEVDGRKEWLDRELARTF